MDNRRPQMMITADDFGLCDDINQAVYQLADVKAITHAAIMANSPDFLKITEELKKKPHLKAAVHLNITNGKAIFGESAVASLVNQAGEFSENPHLVSAFLIMAGVMKTDEIEREWRAQINRCIETGIEIDSLNSHGHLHLLPPLHKIVVKLAREFSIPHIRVFSKNGGILGALLSVLSKRLIKKCFNQHLNVVFSDRIIGFKYSGRLTLEKIKREIDSLKKGESAELIVHPALKSNPFHTRWQYEGAAETAALIKVSEYLRGL